MFVYDGCSIIVFSSLLLLVHSQQCSLPVRGDLEGNGGLIAEALGATTTTLQNEPNLVCLASSSTRNSYRSASVFVTFVRDGSTTVEMVQANLQCIGTSWASAIIDPTPSATDSTALRRDCALCIGSSNDPDFDEEAHCIPCSSSCSSDGLQQCTSPTPTASTCCNFYNSSDACVLSCPMGTIANADNNFTCSDPCSPNPCANQGNCNFALGSAGPSCSCVGSWGGDRCEVCTIADCRTCSQTVDVCSECREGYTVLSGACACQLMCENGGELAESQCSCSCPDGFSGPTCGVGSGNESESCMVDNCLTCSPTSPMVCDECRDGFELDDQQQACSEPNFVGPLSLGAFIGVVVGGSVLILLLLTVVCVCCCCCCFKSSGDSVYV